MNQVMRKPFSVVFFYRKQRTSHNFSIEFIFRKIQSNLPPHIHTVTAVCRYLSNGFWKRLYNAVEAAFRQGDINHITGDVSFLTFFLKKRKTILTIHDCGFMRHPSALARLIFRIFWLILPIYRARIVTVVSTATKEELLKYVHCPPDKIRVIPNFISEKYKPGYKNFRPDKPVILHVGTAPNKNLERLIEALAKIPCHLNIIGKLTNSHTELLKQHDIEYSNAYNLDEDELISGYQQCDLLAFVSTYEGFGLPILEAQSVGRPVVTSNILSMPEVAGEGSCLVDPFNIGDIQNAILRIIKDEAYRESLITKGLENVKRYSLSATIAQYVRLYEEIKSN